MGEGRAGGLSRPPWVFEGCLEGRRVSGVGVGVHSVPVVLEGRKVLVKIRSACCLLPGPRSWLPCAHGGQLLSHSNVAFLLRDKL